ncbi:MAG: family 65 glycosyl hydrolase domain-containing protein [Bacteroidetes bacterium]|nr:family 65 glycosyl hydrolase domain-containing protein [Bacteroidota bacterium]MDA0944376.1 family 65 glycosyl hydrolase domain-containing protein [Bacteroidota bacterium]MDA1112528.1 family 65 glycosyl hydrolase domain-containing protein [Bacteroidota bacterium]
MIDYFKADDWKIIEEGFNPTMNEIAESVFSIGNGMMGQRANLEEAYSGHSLQGTYVGGVYYPDKTRVGWWKNGYPEYFAKVLNSTYWSGLRIWANQEEIDLAKVTVLEFRRELNMHEGLLSRTCRVELKNGLRLRIESKRFYSLISKEYSALKYSITPEQGCDLRWESYVDGDVQNKDSNYEEKFWEPVTEEAAGDNLFVQVRTKKLDWHLVTATHTELYKNQQCLSTVPAVERRSKYASGTYKVSAKAGDRISLVKHAISVSNFHHSTDSLLMHAKKQLQKMAASTFEEHFHLSSNAWKQKWETADVVIEGDVKAQQAVRFNIFHLNQTYCGDDPRLNIGPKGYTGEKYGGSTYWDTEAYCLPFYLVSSDPAISRQLLVYRYKQLDKAIENAQKLGFKDGAALYPMVTMNGEECHNEWEITFEEIHRNGAIAYAIKSYIEHTGDREYLLHGGWEVLLGIARFWSQRVHWSEWGQRYEMHGVTGPNEYENNVNNNWYTNYLARWCMDYTATQYKWLLAEHTEAFKTLIAKTQFKSQELEKWAHISHNLYLPQFQELGIKVQHDGFLEKELIPVADLPESERPLNQKWSWDRILRSPYIKQADVLQGFYFFEDDFSAEEHERNFRFYESYTVHESSLSPCVHSILAAKIGWTEKAYEMYLRTARLDLDNYNNDTEDGLHITSMAGSYLSIVQGFGGLRIKDQKLHLNPHCPSQWKGYEFQILFNNAPVRVVVNPRGTTVLNQGSKAIQVNHPNGVLTLEAGESGKF